MDRALRPCKHRNCNNLTRSKEGYCKEHIQEYLEKVERQRKKAMQKYDSKRKGDKYRLFYMSNKWKATRQYILARDNYLCQDCLNNKKITTAEHVHHIKELKEDWDKRYDTTNLLSLCSNCHNKRHNRF